MVRLYYDGLCLVCSSEISHYKKMNGSQNIEFVDITTSTFDASTEGLNPRAIHKELHAKDDQGQIHVGVDAFILVWSRLDKLNWLARLAQKPAFKKLLQFNYKIFTQLRPYLPRKSCQSSPYCEMKPSDYV